MALSRVRFDRGPLRHGTEFAQPLWTIRAGTAAEVGPAFDDIAQAQQAGHWLAGYASYELGYVLEPKLAPLLPAERELPLLHFGVFEAPAPPPPLARTHGCALSPAAAQWDFARYAAAFRTVLDYLTAGDIYQANLTFPLATRRTGSAEGLYAALCRRQPVPHGAFVDLGDGAALLSRSPELFFSLSSGGRLTTRPMKGTAPRGESAAEDLALRRRLQASEKNRAENLMIVDLLRNDMSRVSETGSVRVPEIFAIEAYETLFQMTSCITSQVRPGTTVRALFEALFPCGSITGAPKLRAMQILHELEAGPREAYCGTIGWIAPDGAMEFNVAIRTLLCRADGTARMNVGGGVVYDSTAQDEYAEAILKSRYAYAE